MLANRIVTTMAKKATIQQPLLSNLSGNKHVSMATISLELRKDVFYVASAEIL
jgi:hypothetical protein